MQINNSPDLSIVMPVYNNWFFTKNCINNLSKLRNDMFEIIIVDNASTDQTNIEMEKIINIYPNFKYIRNKTNLGFGAAVNIGIKNSSSDLLIMTLNNDIKFGEFNPHWWETTIDAMDHYANTLIGPTGGYVDPNNDFAFVYETNDPNKKINYMSGWCLTAHKETWNKLVLSDNDGPFDSNTYFLYFEDTDLSAYAKSLNINFKLIDFPLIHIGKQTSKLLNTSKHYAISREKFIKKWTDKKHLF